MEYLFNNFTLDPEKFELREQGKLVPLEPQVFLLLKLLIENRSRMVSKDEIIESIWNGRIVSDASIANRIKSARLSVGDDGNAQHTIRTTYGQGFRFIAAVSSGVSKIEERPTLEENIPPQNRWLLGIGAGLSVILIFAAFSAWQIYWPPTDDQVSLERMAYSLPDKPSVAVLPFINMSEDKSQAYFANGMTDDLITDLSKLSGLFVISRNSTFDYKDRSVNVRQVAEELGVRYILEGSVRRDGDKLRINAQLIDALSGHHLWAERYDSTFIDVFKLQDKVIADIVAAMSITLTAPESGRLETVETSVPAAYDAYLQGREHFSANDPENTAHAIQFFKTAIKLDPEFYSAHASLASAYWKVYGNSWSVRVKITSTDAVELAKKHLSVALKKPSAVAYRTSAAMNLFFGKHEKALEEINQAILSDPNDAANFIDKSDILIYSGAAQEAEKYTRLAMRLNPKFPARYLNVLGKALFNQGKYEDAAKILERAVKREPDYEYHYTYLIPTYGHLNQMEKARLAIETFHHLRAGSEGGKLTVQAPIEWTNYANLAGRKRFQIGSRKAGVPEGSTPAIAEDDLRKLIAITSHGYEVKGVQTIDLEEAERLHKKGTLFVEVCAIKEQNPHGNIPGSVRLDYKTEFTKANLAKHAGKETLIIFYCDGKYCYRSPYASAKSSGWGYSNIRYFAGGTLAWKEAGFPLADISAD